MSSSLSEHAMQTLEVKKDIVIAAPIEVVFETILEQMGPYNEAPRTGLILGYSRMNEKEIRAGIRLLGETF